MVTSHRGAGFWLLPKRRKKKEKLYIYIYIYTYIYIYIYERELGLDRRETTVITFSVYPPTFEVVLTRFGSLTSPYVPLGHQSGSALWLRLCNIWAS